MKAANVTSRLGGQHVATIAYSCIGPNFSKLSQESVRRYNIIACLKNENPKPNLKTWFLDFLTPENLPKIR